LPPDMSQSFSRVTNMFTQDNDFLFQILSSSV